MRDIYKKSKTVSEALDTRLTCRAFKSTEIKKKVIFDILDKARRAPSGGNLQPWRVWVVSGDPLKSFKEEIYSNGGRVLNFVILSEKFEKSRDDAIKLIKEIKLSGGFYRKDIGYKVID